MTLFRIQRAHTRGQVVVTVALMAVLLFGMLALAIDLSIQTNNRRTIQNAADYAALAGVINLKTPSTPNASDQKQALADALASIGNNMGWPANWSSSGVIASCGSGFCETVTAFQPASGSPTFSVTVSTPPQDSTEYTGYGYEEVRISEQSQNQIAGIIGQPTNTVAGQAIAFYSGTAGPSAWALYSSTWIQMGNYPEVVYGDTYVGQGLLCQAKQCGGHSALCVLTDSSGSPPVADAQLAFGAPQPPASPPSSWSTADLIVNYSATLADCTESTATTAGTTGAAWTAGAPSTASCPNGSTFDASLSGTDGICIFTSTPTRGTGEACGSHASGIPAWTGDGDTRKRT